MAEEIENNQAAASAVEEPKAQKAEKAPEKAKGDKKKPDKAKQRKQREWLHRILRLVIQIAFFVLAPGVFASALNGVKYLFTQMGAMQAIAPTSFVVILVGILAYTIVFGRFFCGYGCAFGTAQDVISLVFMPIRKLLHLPSINQLPILNRALSWVKYVVLGIILYLCFTASWATVSSYSPWTAFGILTSGNISELNMYAVGLLVAFGLASAFCERFFCKYLCPMGGVFSLMPILPFFGFNRRVDRCAKNCDRCQHDCPVGIHPDKHSQLSGECISCGRCVDICPMGNVNMLHIEKQVNEALYQVPEDATPQQVKESKLALAKAKRAARDAAVKLRGNGVAMVLIQALLLFAVCWLIGGTRFIPTPAEVLPFALPW